MPALLRLIQAPQLEAVHDEGGDVLQVLAVVLGELGPGPVVEDAQRADLVA